MVHRRPARKQLPVSGATFQGSPPALADATPHESRRPFEVFINSKNMDHFQWIVALTRIISAVFRKGGDCTFLAEELRSVFDPRGGYFKPGGRFMPSLVAEIGEIIERHLVGLGMLDVTLDAHRKAFVEDERRAAGLSDGAVPPGAQLCSRCHTVAALMQEGCLTCLSRGESKCG